MPQTGVPYQLLFCFQRPSLRIFSSFFRISRTFSSENCCSMYLIVNNIVIFLFSVRILLVQPWKSTGYGWKSMGIVATLLAKCVNSLSHASQVPPAQQLSHLNTTPNKYAPLPFFCLTKLYATTSKKLGVIFLPLSLPHTVTTILNHNHPFRIVSPEPTHFALLPFLIPFLGLPPLFTLITIITS